MDVTDNLPLEPATGDETLSRTELQIEQEKLKLERERILLERERLESVRERVQAQAAIGSIGHRLLPPNKRKAVETANGRPARDPGVV